MKLIHYFGESSVYKPQPHGNNKKDKPSTLMALKEQLGHKDAHQVYKNNEHINPRNTKQCRNLKYNIRRNKLYHLTKSGTSIFCKKNMTAHKAYPSRNSLS
jgi:hypothetical protein